MLYAKEVSPVSKSHEMKRNPAGKRILDALARGIRANVLQSDMVVTTGEVEEWEKVARNSGLLERTALGRAGHKEACLAAAVFLASDESAYIYGQRMRVDDSRI